METFTLFIGLVCIAGGFVGGWFVRGHVGQIASAAATATQRATTIPSGDLDKLHSISANLATAAASAAAAVQAPTVAAVTAAGNAAVAAAQPSS